MKHILIALLLLVFSTPLFSQQVSPGNQYRYDRFIRSAQRRQTGGIIFLSSGAVVTTAGILIINDGSRRNRNANNYGIYDAGFSNGGLEIFAGAVVTFMGVGSMCGSIPFFIGAHRSRKRAMALTVKTENASFLFKAGVVRQYYPALALQIPFGGLKH